MNRNKLLLSVRPLLELSRSEGMSSHEIFQNEVLRPLLKFQNELLCQIFMNEVKARKHLLDYSSTETFRRSVESILKKDQKTKSKIVQSITAFMTIEEFDKYTQQESELKRRIVGMAIQRLSDQFFSKKERTENA